MNQVLKQSLSECKKRFWRAVLAGVLIGVSGIGYLSAGGLAGACLFSFGLVAVVSWKCDLFTGAAGFATKENWADLIWVLAGNLAGTFLAGLAAKASPMSLGEAADKIVSLRISTPRGSLFILSAGCGLLMTTAVKFARQSNWLPLLFAVPMFIICGFPHCVADSLYVFAGDWSKIPEYWAKYIFTVAGNFAGCNLPRVMGVLQAGPPRCS